MFQKDKSYKSFYFIYMNIGVFLSVKYHWVCFHSEFHNTPILMSEIKNFCNFCPFFRSTVLSVCCYFTRNFLPSRI